MSHRSTILDEVCELTRHYTTPVRMRDMDWTGLLKILDFLSRDMNNDKP